MNLAENNIQYVLDKRGWSQQKLAEKVGVRQGDISDIALGKRTRLTLVIAAKISKELGYSVEYLWPDLFK